MRPNGSLEAPAEVLSNPIEVSIDGVVQLSYIGSPIHRHCSHDELRAWKLRAHDTFVCMTCNLSVEAL